MLRKIIDKFIALEAKSGVLLLLAAALAFGWANSPWGSSYFALFQAPLTLFGKTLSVQYWINDLLMALFFLLVGMEIKREMLLGELAGWQRAALPLVGALGGVAAPALIYAAINHASPTQLTGWAVPAATDIAFAVGVLLLFGRGLPPTAKIFLLAVAIIDDLMAIIIIAVFYTANLQLLPLAGALALVASLHGLNRAGIHHLGWYLGAAPLLWLLIYYSGLHATIAGVLLATAIPLRLAHHAHSPLLRLEHGLHPWVIYGIMPLFALANAGVTLAGLSAEDWQGGVLWGTALGLTVGKVLGISAACWVAVRCGLARLPEGLSWAQLRAVAALAGIGFTMALFIAGLAFANPHYLDQAKMGIVLGSLSSALLGAWLLARARK